MCLSWFPLKKTEKARGLEGVVKRPWSVPPPGLKVLSLGASWGNMTDFQDSKDIPGLRPRGPRRCQLKSRSTLSFSRRGDVDWLGRCSWGLAEARSSLLPAPGLPSWAPSAHPQDPRRPFLFLKPACGAPFIQCLEALGAN